jgi:hypothetical protein
MPKMQVMKLLKIKMPRMMRKTQIPRIKMLKMIQQKIQIRLQTAKKQMTQMQRLMRIHCLT